MENELPVVELVPDPKVESRFGINSDRRIQSGRAFKIGALVAAISISAALFIKKPENPNASIAEISPPEIGQLQQNQPHFDSYYPVNEEVNLKKSHQKRSRVEVNTRLPGLQKIDRRNAVQIPPGSAVRAVLLTGASNGTVKAEIKEPLQIQGETLIPAGSTIVGKGQSVEDRLAVHFSQIVFKDGTFESIDAQAADIQDKTVGLRGSRVGSYAMKYGAAIGLNFVGAMAESLQDRQAVGLQAVTVPSTKNALLSGTSKATLELAGDTMNDIKNKPPVIVVPEGQEILIIFESKE